MSDLTPVQWTSDEWSKINAELPHVAELCSRIRVWPRMEYLSAPDLVVLKRLRLSQVCFRDGANTLDNARYALGQAVATRQYFLAQSTVERDNSHILADLRSRFYADYVPLLLYTTAEHLRNGIIEMLGMNGVKYSGKYEIKRLRNALQDLFKDSALTKAVVAFDESPAREQLRKYRNNWVHKKPMRVESILYDPPRADFIIDNEDVFPWPAALMGAEVDVDFSWEELLNLLKEGVQVTATILEACAVEWEKLYDQGQARDERLWDPGQE